MRSKGEKMRTQLFLKSMKVVLQRLMLLWQKIWELNISIWTIGNI